MRLNFDSIKGKKSATAVRTALKGLPTGSQAYHHAYDAALVRIEGQLADQAEVAKQVLAWITFAKRPLRAAEIESAIAIIDGQQSFDFENICPVEDLISTCAGLVTMDEETEVVRLVHYTTQQYLEETGDRWFPNAQDHLAHACVTYLSLEDFSWGSARTGRGYRDRLFQYPLYRYASLHWGRHVLPASELSQTIMSFLESDRNPDGSSQALVFETDYNEEMYLDFQDDHLDSLEDYDDHNYYYDSDTGEYSLPYYLEAYGTGLHLASYFGLDKYVSALLGALPDAIDRTVGTDQRTPLSWAAEQGHKAVAALLIARGANVEAGDRTGKTPLSWAAAHGQDAIVKLLIDSGADIRSKDEYGRMPIFFAIANCHESTVALLLDAGADVASADKFRDLPLMVAVQSKSRAIVSLLLQRGAPADAEESGDTVLSEALINQQVGIARTLLEHGAKIRAADLFEACRKHRRAVIELMILYGTGIEERDDHGQTPLSLAVRRTYDFSFEFDAPGSHQDRCLDTVKYLLDRGVDIETRDNQGRTPLSWAAEKGYVAVVKILLEHGAEVESRDEQNKTPLVYAILEGRAMAAAQLLCQGGARFEPPEWYSPTRLLFTAAQGRRQAVMVVLRKQLSQCATQKSSQTLDHDGKVDAFEVLVSMGADVGARDERGRTPLSWAAEARDVDSIRTLLDRGADPEAADVDGLTPLMWVSRTDDQLEDMKAFLGHEADPDEPADTEERMVDYAAIIRLLLERGADIESRDKDTEQTPLLWAIADGSRDAVQALLENGADVHAKDRSGLEPLELVLQVKQRRYRDDSEILKKAIACRQKGIAYRRSRGGVSHFGGYDE